MQNGLLTEIESIEMRRINGQVGGLPFYEELFHLDLNLELQSLKIPMLLIHGERDSTVHIAHSEQYVKARQESDSTEFIRLLNADHDFTFSEERKYAIEKTVNWFKENL
jgi:alpha-beta hydrolase superfamily lysophospholipase